VVVRSQDPGGKTHPTIADLVCPTVLVIGHTGSAVCFVGSVAEDRTGSVINRTGPETPTADSSREVAPGEAGTDSVGDQGVEDVDQRDGSNLSLAVGYLCLHRTWKLLESRVSSKREIAGGHTRSCSCGRKRDKPLAGRARRERYFGSYCCIQPGGKGRTSAGGDKHDVPNAISAR